MENEAYIKHFAKKLKVDDVFILGNKEARYLYQITYQGTTYTLKPFKIRVEFDPKSKESLEVFEQNLMQMNEYFRSIRCRGSRLDFKAMCEMAL